MAATEAIVLGVIVAAIYAAGNLTDKALFLWKLDEPLALLVMTALAAPILGFIAAAVYGVSVPPTGSLFFLLISGGLFVVATLFQLTATKTGDVSNISLLYKLIPVFTIGLSVVLLGEQLALETAAGIGIILFGAVLVAVDPTDGVPKVAPSMANGLMLLASLSIASAYVILDASVGSVSAWTVFFWQQIGIFLSGLVLLAHPSVQSALAGIAPRSRDIAPLLGLRILLYGGANLLVIIAFGLSSAAIVSSLIAIDTLFVLTMVAVLAHFGYRRFEEDMGRASLGVKLIAALLFLIGTYLVN